MRSARTLAEHTGFYHVILKATGPQMLFTEDADKRDFLSILERSARFSGVDVLSFAPLDNHFHLLVMVPEHESVPIKRKHPTPLAQCNVALFSAMRLRGMPLAVA